MNQEDQILKEDMEILGADRKLAEKFSGKTVFVTGATGLIGTQAVYALSMMNKICKSDIHVIAMRSGKGWYHYIAVILMSRFPVKKKWIISFTEQVLQVLSIL